MQNIKQIVAAGMLFFCLISCASASNILAYDRSFIGTEWSVVSFLDDQNMISVSNDYPITMNFSPDGWVFGSAGCNQYSGAYTLEEDTTSLSLGPLRTTRMACEEKAMEQETAFIEAISGVIAYHDEDGFTLNGADNQVIIVLEPFVEPEDASLTGTVWNLVSYGSEYTMPPAGVVPTVVFSDDGTLSGTSGCNSFFGQYQVEEQAMSIGQVGSTLMACFDNEVMSLEAEYLALLQDTASYVIDVNFLTLYNENAEAILLFEYEPEVQIYNTPFELRSFTVDGEMRYVLTDSVVTFELGEDGRISGNAGCNTYSAGVSFDENDPSLISISQAVSTMMFCNGDGIMEQESAYLAALGSVHSFDFDGTSLRLYDANGETVAIFTVAAE